MRLSVRPLGALAFSTLLVAHSAGGALAVEKPMDKLAIYAAKGPPDSCGPGCDHWIAIEGRVDEGSAARVERFLRERKDIQQPIYFNSPGGAMRDGLAIGRLLRARKAIGRVGRTIVDACPGTQTDDACTLIKTMREEVVATVTSRGAVCGSACTFMLFGAPTREVAPDAIVAVHGARIAPQFRINVNAAQREEAIARMHAEADRLTSAFVEEMGISRIAMALADSVSPDDLHVLTRRELYGFRIDTRTQVETAWIMQKGPAPSVQKIVEVKTNSGFRKFEWRLVCGRGADVRLIVAASGARDQIGVGVITLAAGAKPPTFTRLLTGAGPNEIWTAVISPEAMAEMLAASRLPVGEGVLPEPNTASIAFDIDTTGLRPALAELTSACQQAPAGAATPKWPSTPSSPRSPWPAATNAPGPPNWPAPSPLISQGIGLVGVRPPPPTAAPK
jgi:hypothetical protein